MDRRRRRAWLALASVLVVSSGSPSLLARDPQRAAELFREGRTAMAARNYAVACERFEQSQREDPREGTLINLAQCEEAQGKIAAAHRYWQQADDLAQALGDPRADYDREQLTRLAPHVPRVSIRIEDNAPPGTAVTRDGIDFGAGSLGVALPVEVGAHLVVATAPGYAARRYDLDLHDGETLEIVVGPGPMLSLTNGEHVSTRTGLSRTLRAIVYVGGALGLVSLAVGTTFGIRAVDDTSAASGHCSGDACDASGLSARRAETSDTTAATVALGSGAGLVASAALLRLLTPSPSERPYVTRNLGHLASAVGAGATVLGTIFGLHAIQANREASYECSGDVCNPQGATDRRQAIQAGNASTILLASGAATLGAGIILWHLGSKSSERARQSPSPALSLSVGPTAAAIVTQW